MDRLVQIKTIDSSLLFNLMFCPCVNSTGVKNNFLFRIIILCFGSDGLNLTVISPWKKEIKPG